MIAGTSVADIDTVISSLRRGVPVAAATVPGGEGTVAALRRLYSHQPFLAIADTGAVDQHIAIFVTGWLQVERGVYCPGSRHLTKSYLYSLEKRDNDWLVDVTAKVIGALFAANTADGDAADTAAKAFGSYVALVVGGIPDDMTGDLDEMIRRYARTGPEPDLARRVAAISHDASAPTAWLEAAVRVVGDRNPVAVARDYQALRKNDSFYQEMLSLFGFAGMWDGPQSRALTMALEAALKIQPDPQNVDRFTVPATLPGPAVALTAAEERFLVEVLTCVTRRCMLGRRDGGAAPRSWDRAWNLFRLGKLLTAWGHTSELRESAQALIVVAERRLPEIEHTLRQVRAMWKAENRRARRRFSAGVLALVPAAYCFGEIGNVLPGWLGDLVALPLLTGAVFGLRRWAKFRDWYPWWSSIAGGVGGCLAYWAGRADPIGQAFTWATYAPKGAEVYPYLWAVAGLGLSLTLVLSLRIPWIRPKFQVTSLDDNNALPFALKNEIDDEVGSLLR